MQRDQQTKLVKWVSGVWSEVAKDQGSYDNRMMDQAVRTPYDKHLVTRQHITHLYNHTIVKKETMNSQCLSGTHYFTSKQCLEIRNIEGHLFNRFKPSSVNRNVENTSLPQEQKTNKIVLLTRTEWITMCVCHFSFRRTKHKGRVELVNNFLKCWFVIQICIAATAVFLG